MHQTPLMNIPTIEQLEGGNNSFPSDPDRITPDVSKFIRPNNNTGINNTGNINFDPPMSNTTFIKEPHPMGFNNNYRELNCVEISDHIKDCPVCSRLYKPDTSVHMILILLLGSLCLILTHKIINK